ncbi:hypothetical protein SCP_0114530 [Sparassis crispa]|uniref:Uncharacterized protein n=1 Tax=Sparassis crispa TaxID=139825 RepID=A0A401G8S0_9APHY|nr:hypothetical protein SCP_0114530 [Sparassis crispa]GBE78564.1 hypothetical protein SCP_0114530 [Sparassis crispa]
MCKGYATEVGLQDMLKTIGRTRTIDLSTKTKRCSKCLATRHESSDTDNKQEYLGLVGGGHNNGDDGMDVDLSGAQKGVRRSSRLGGKSGVSSHIEQHVSDGYEPDKDDDDEDNYDQEPRNTEQTPQTRKKKQPLHKVLASFYVSDESVEEGEQDQINSDQVTESENDSDTDDTVHATVLSLFKK